MAYRDGALILLAALVTFGVCFFVSIPIIFAHRVPLLVKLADTPLTGISSDDLPGVLARYQETVRAQVVPLTIRDQTLEHSVGDLGVMLDRDATLQAIRALTWPALLSAPEVPPVLAIDPIVFAAAIHQSFGDTLSEPKNATLQLTPTVALALVKSEPGEGVEIDGFKHALVERIVGNTWLQPINLAIVPKAPSVLDHEVDAARVFAQQLLKDGMVLTFEDKSWELKPFTIRRLLQFRPMVDPGNPANEILGVTLREAELATYLANTIAPEVATTAQNARFEMNEEGRVTQFAQVTRGQELSIDDSVQRITTRIAAHETVVPLAVTITEPSVASAEDIAALGIGELIASGESDFAGSPHNRLHNIQVGAARYHGLLIPPGAEFSFNEHLGPVTAAAGFKPELVIKHNVTTPEFGGGLCQVSTTLFRAAVYAGFEITARRNHAYAVRYYGVPGFDATIYPPYTDLRFTNNTPGYILVQVRLDGTILKFEFWGTKDGRTVTVTGPLPYDRQSNGAVKATLTQTVSKDGEVVLEKKFYSRYKSPALFPKAVTAQAPPAPQPTPSP